MEHPAEEMIRAYAARTDLMTATKKINYVLVSPVSDLNIICIIAEMWFAVASDQFVLLHSGRTPLEV